MFEPLASSHCSVPLTTPSPQRGPNPVHVALQAPYMPLQAPLSQVSPVSSAPLPHWATSTNSYAPMSHCAPPMPLPSSGRDRPSASVVGPPEVPASIATLLLCRCRSVALTYCGLALSIPRPGVMPNDLLVEWFHRFEYETA